MYPRIKVYLPKLKDNLEQIATTVKSMDNSTAAIVTKCVCADPEVVKIIADSPKVDYIADSRIQNVASFADLAHEKGKKTLLLRIPMESELAEVVRYVDLCQISEIETIRLLNEQSKAAQKVQDILLMIDMGDLREGLFYQNRDQIHETIAEILSMENINLHGISVNLTCYGAIIPTPDNLGQLVEVAREIEARHGIKLEMVSGGNSSSIYLCYEGRMPQGINNLRIGEGFVLGTDTASGERLPGTSNETFLLEAQIVELQEKPSIPIGEIGVDAFGNKPEFTDRGIRKRAIIAVGKQDVDPDDITPLDDRIEILGGSSDHIILDLTDCADDYKLGSTVEFRLKYGALLRLMTSPYVEREYIR